MSRLDFVMCGLTIAYLNKAGTLPVYRDVFRIAVMIGSSLGMHYFSNQVGMGSSAQDELDADSIVLCISSEVANLRQSSFTPVSEAMSRSQLESDVKLIFNLEIFSTKNLLNNSARTESSSEEGMVARFLVFFLKKKLPIVVVRDVCPSVRPSVCPSVVCGNILFLR